LPDHIDSRVRRAGIAALLVTGVLAVYSNHFLNEFHFDDAHTVQSNPYIRDLHNIGRFFTDVREVATGFECGIGLTDFQDLKDGDVIETFDEREIPRT